MATKRTRGTAARTTRQAPVKKSPSLKVPSLSNITLKKFILPGLIILGILVLGFFKNQFIAATVNGEQITRLELIQALEKSDGQRILQNLVSQKLIEQEAEKRNLTVSDQEINEEIVKIEASIAEQGQNLDDLLAVQNFTREQLKEQLKTQLLLQKMVDESKTEVTDEEIDQYIEQNQESFPEETDIEEIRGDLGEQLKQQKLNGEVQALLTKLQGDAQIDILIN